MPTYEYECTKCAHVFERFQAMTDAPVKRCPKCRCKVRKLFGTGAGILFKGSGFYQTDYRSSGYQRDAKKDADTATAAKSPSETKTSSESSSASSTKPKKESGKAKSAA